MSAVSGGSHVRWAMTEIPAKSLERLMVRVAFTVAPRKAQAESDNDARSELQRLEALIHRRRQEAGA